MSTFTLELTCRQCGGEVEHVNSAVTRTGDLAVLVVSCVECRRQWEVTARLVPHAAPRSRCSQPVERPVGNGRSTIAR